MSAVRLAARKGTAIVLLPLDGLLAFEANGRLTYAHHDRGLYSIDLSLNAVALALRDRLLRVHRSWLVVPARVDQLGRVDGDLMLTLGTLRVPVARERTKDVRAALLLDTVGLTPIAATKSAASIAATKSAASKTAPHSSSSTRMNSSTAKLSLSNVS